MIFRTADSEDPQGCLARDGTQGPPSHSGLNDQWQTVLGCEDAMLEMDPVGMSHAYRPLRGL
jgi:hypothetical protein